MRVKIYTNIQKSQFRDLGNGKLQILGIPITVDDAVMNGILYDKADNAAGLATYRDQPVTLRHPEDENGNGVSALSGKGLIDHFSGGVIINTYNSHGVNYADAEFKEKMMLAQENGEYYVNRLKNGESIGISTGLFFDGNNESGISATGEEYHAKAINQQGDHVAMLPDEEPPAGGAATFIRFNGENDDQELTINIDEMLLAISEDVSAIIDTVATNDDEKSLLSRFFALCKQAFAKEKNDCDNVNDNKLITNKEGDAMRETLIAALAAKGITVNAEITDGELLAKYNESNKVEVPDVAAAINTALAPLTATVAKLQGELTANADKELDALAKQAAPLMGLEEAEAKAMGVNALHKVLAKNGVTVGVDSGTNHKSPEGNKDTSAITMEPWLTEGEK
jgi:hypothetical protein